MDKLTAAEINALHEALDDEYQAWSIYDQVITGRSQKLSATPD